MIDGQDLARIKGTYDTIAKEYAVEFFGEHKRSQKTKKSYRDLHRELETAGRSGILAVAPVKPHTT